MGFKKITEKNSLYNNLHKMSTEEIINNLLRIGESIGDVMEETRKALNDDNVDESEKEKIALQVKNLEKKIAELKFKLDLGEKTDYSKVQRRE